jgi:radical SAM enzyme (TIGR01210 family)
VDAARPYAFLSEKERSAEGLLEDVSTIFLTNRECPFRCLMCDLWKNTLDDTVPKGAIPTQIRWALGQLPPAAVLKLYNSGNFFDPNAILEDDYPAIADLCRPFRKVIVESHPRVLGRRCLDFHQLVGDRLQVAMGLETAHAETLARLNKRMTLAEFDRATRFLVERGIPVRAFILLRPPFMSEAEGIHWAKRSIDFAFDVGVECCALIPARAGNGAMDELARRGEFAPPSAAALEEVLEYGLRLRRGRVLADLWDLENAAQANDGARLERMKLLNLTQVA